MQGEPAREAATPHPPLLRESSELQRGVGRRGRRAESAEGQTPDVSPQDPVKHLP